MKERFDSFSPFMQVIFLLVIGVVSFFILSMLMASIIQSLYEGLPSSPFLLAESHPIQFMLLYFLPFQLGFILTPGLLYFYLKRDGIVFIPKGFHPAKTLWSILLFLCVFLLLPLLTDINIEIVRFFGLLDALEAQKLAADEQIALLVGKESSFSAFLVGIILIGLLTGVAEEFLFRGFLFNHLLEHTRSLNKSIIVSALLFALLHFNFIQIIPLFFFGIALALIYHITKRLYVCILLHALNNGINVYWLRSEKTPYFMEETIGWIASLALLLAIALFLFAKKKEWTSLG